MRWNSAPGPAGLLENLVGYRCVEHGYVDRGDMVKMLERMCQDNGLCEHLYDINHKIMVWRIAPMAVGDRLQHYKRYI